MFFILPTVTMTFPTTLQLPRSEIAESKIWTQISSSNIWDFAELLDIGVLVWTDGTDL